MEGVLTTADIFHFYREFEEDIPKTTVNWRVYELVKRGILERVGRGRFEWGSETSFIPVIEPKIQQLNSKILSQFPFISYCLWDTEMIKPFRQHVPGSKFTLLDVEKDVLESIFVFMKEFYSNIYLTPDKEMIDQYIITNKDSVIIRQLISESPIRNIQHVHTVTIEKMIVDIYSDVEFEYLKGSELLTIIKNIFDRYTVNKSKLLRYANRKGQQKRIIKFLEDNNLIEPRFIHNK